MGRFLAFLQLLKMGRKNKLSKNELVTKFEQHGAENIKLFRGISNVNFNYTGDIQELQQAIENDLEERLRVSIPVMIRSLEQIRKLVEINPFTDIENSANQLKYTTILYNPEKELEIPSSVTTVKGDFKFILQKYGVIFTVVSNNQGIASPNVYLSETLDTACTTRNYSTLQKLVKQ